MKRLLISSSYFLITFLASFALLVIFLFYKRGRKRIFERLGFWQLKSEDIKASYIWFHGPSVGEINGLLPLIKAVRKKNPDVKILLTATSVTGLERGAAEADLCRLLTFDNPLWIALACRKLKIRKFIFSETEIWPALFNFMSRRKIPSFLVNGRISDYSFKSYRFLRFIVKPALKSLTAILVSDELAHERFKALGALNTQLKVTGNTKNDLQPSVKSTAEAATLKQSFFSEDLPVIVLASMWPGEEELWFKAIQEVINDQPEFNLIVAPRHQEKFSFFETKLNEFSFAFKKRSTFKNTESAKHQERVVLLDTLGELESTYSFANLAFIGGTLIDIGGHNPLEAAAYGAPLVLGPYVSNVESVVNALKKQNAVTRIKTLPDIRSLLKDFLQSPKELIRSGKQARTVYEQSAGATDKILQVVNES